jgi:transcriptional regulator with XRE-family HTH domain
MAARDSVSEKIDYLFKTVRREDGREYTYDDVEQGTEGRVSRSYVWKLRHGRNNNPSLEVIESLARLFRVPPSYFFGDELEVNRSAKEAADVAALLQDDAAHEVAEKARGLSPTALGIVSDLLDNLRSLDKPAPKRRRRTKTSS